MLNRRYKVKKYSVTGHCCFEATVVDTETPTLLSDGSQIRSFSALCECLDVKQAKLIAKVLNAQP